LEFYNVGFHQGGKPENLKENPWERTNSTNKPNSQDAKFGNKTSASVVRGEHS
jgi:hypothetical protein